MNKLKTKFNSNSWRKFFFQKKFTSILNSEIFSLFRFFFILQTISTSRFYTDKENGPQRLFSDHVWEKTQNVKAKINWWEDLVLNEIITGSSRNLKLLSK